MATIFGTIGDDVINGSFATPTTPGADTIYALAGDDVIVRSLGNDTIDGGAGFDALDYAGTANTVVVNVSVGLLCEIGAGGVLMKFDIINSIEEFRTGSGDDLLQGSGADENFAPGLGSDQVRGGGGLDTVIYGTASARVFVDLVRGFALDWDDFRDTLQDIEGARGGAFNDVLRAGADFTFLRGNKGADTLISGYDGKASTSGATSADYGSGPAGVTVDLKAGTATDDWGDHDLLVGNFYGVRGSAFADTLLGNDLNNGFRPRGGADIIDGRSGSDTADYGDATLTVRVVLGTGGSVDTISSGRDRYFSIGNIVDGSARDFLTGDAGANRIEGRDGNDIIAGGRALTCCWAGPATTTSPAAWGRT